MFARVYWDETVKDPNFHPDFRTCLEFVADEFVPVCAYLNTDWTKSEVLRISGLDVHKINPSIENELEKLDLLPKSLDFKTSPRLALLDMVKFQATEDSTDRLPIRTLKSELLFSPSDIVNRASLLDRAFSAETLVLCLAAAGLEISLPSLRFSRLNSHEVSRIKEDLKFERLQYLNAVTNLASDARDALNSTSMEELLIFARNEAFFKIAPAARQLELSIKKFPRKHLKNAGFSSWWEGLPVLGAAFLTGGLGTTASVAGAQFLSTFVKYFADKEQTSNEPLLGYSLKIRRQLEKPN